MRRGPHLDAGANRCGPHATSAPNTGREINQISPVDTRIAIRTGSTLRRQVTHAQLPPVGAFLSPSADTPRATLAARTCSPFIQSTDSGPVSCRAVSVGDRHHTALITGLNWFLPPVEPNFCLTPSYQPASDPLRQGTDLNEVGRRSLVHAANHRSKHGQGVVEVGQGVGQFSQAEG